MADLLGPVNAKGRQNMIKAAIFDIDGTLVDSVDIHAKCWQEAFRDFDVDATFDEIRTQIGKGGDQLMPEFLSKDQLDRIGKDLEEHRSKIFKDKYMHQIRPFAQVRELFARIKKDGVKIAVGSSAKKDEVDYYLDLVGVTDLVDVTASSEDADKSKPHPDIFEAVLGKLHIAAADALVVGDSPYDAEAAKRAGIIAYGVLCGGFWAEDLQKAGAKQIYGGPAEMLEKYDQIKWSEDQKNEAEEKMAFERMTESRH